MFLQGQENDDSRDASAGEDVNFFTDVTLLISNSLEPRSGSHEQQTVSFVKKGGKNSSEKVKLKQIT